jgi:hypothetical protein
MSLSASFSTDLTNKFKYSVKLAPALDNKSKPNVKSWKKITERQSKPKQLL